MTEHSNAALTRRVFAAFGQDAKQVSAALSRDIVWRVPATDHESRYPPARVIVFLPAPAWRPGHLRSSLHTVLSTTRGRWRSIARHRLAQGIDST